MLAGAMDGNLSIAQVYVAVGTFLLVPVLVSVSRSWRTDQQPEPRPVGMSLIYGRH